MAADPIQFVVRRPRHEAVQNPTVRIWLESPHTNLPLDCEVELVDLSRQGAHLRLSRPVEPGESFLIRIQCEDAQLDVTLQGIQRWQRTDGPEKWAVWCVFDEELGYELMGELFLSGILDMEPAEE